MKYFHTSLHKNKLHHFQNLLSLSALTLIITVWATVFYLKYQNNLMKVSSRIPETADTPPQYQQVIANWRTFTGSEFQVSYPSDWILKRPSYSDHIIIFSFEPTQDFQKLLQGNGIRLEIYPQEYDQINGDNFEKVVDWYNKIYMTTPNITKAPDQVVILGKTTAVKRVVTVPENGRLLTNYYYFINGGNKIYIITYLLHNLNENQEGSINQILSTFEFVDNQE